MTVRLEHKFESVLAVELSISCVCQSVVNEEIHSVSEVKKSTQFPLISFLLTRGSWAVGLCGEVMPRPAGLLG